ncbi:MAG: TIGR01440 family protein [Ruminococcaceae bacterium]|nr:TIGR01440 family protein [Oscillospiraceae bacterium]
MSEELKARLDAITEEARRVAEELCEVASLKAGDALVVGCSTSEVSGNTIGKASVRPVAEAVFKGIYPVLREKGIYIAAQCCEHLNRAVIVEREYAEKHGLDVVCVRPQPKAGGSFATVTYDTLTDPVALEHIKANAGVDIGGTLVGMHLREVAVPVRLSLSKIGDANIICARTRPKFIGGPRAVYE